MDILNFKKRFFSFSSLGKYFSDFWENNFRMFFVIFSIIVLSAGIYLWYQSIFKSDWNSEKKNLYKSSKNKNIELKENQFKSVVEEVDRKRAVYEGKTEFAKDIFAPYPEDAVVSTDLNNPGTSSNNIAPAPSKQNSPTF